MAVVEQQVSALELEKVVTKIRVLFERDDKFYSNIKKRDVETISNRQMRLPLELRPGGSFQYFDANGGDLGRGGGPTWDKAVVSAVFLSENIEYTKLTQWSTDSDRKAITNGVKRLTATALDEMRKQLDNQLMQDGSGTVGVVGTATAVGNVNTIVMNADGFGAKLVRYGQTLQVYNAAKTTLVGKGLVTLYDVENNTIDLTSTAPLVIPGGSVLVVDGLTSPNSLPGLYGVPYHHSNAAVGTWLGFSRATTPEIRSNRVNGGGNSLALPLPRLCLNKIGNRLGMENNFKPKAWLHPCQKQAYEEIGQAVSYIQKQPKEEGLDMYFERMSFAGAPDSPSYSWDKKRIDFVSDEVWGRAEILPIGFYTSDGRKIFEIRSSNGGVSAADIFYMTVGMQVFVNNPAATSYIDNLAVPTGY